MRNLENKIIAGALVLMCAVLVTVMVLTIKIKNRLCDCPGNIITESVKKVDQQIYESNSKIDSISRFSDTTIDGAARELRQRYNR
ncbi:hypothetical protein [Dyadobacter bucti]|uniref:hypothetical protein n=1 Tax=Dyadobacter bucti TaxID=2572203 RepID=UPI003F72ECF2